MYELHEGRDIKFITMEYVAGEDLKSQLRRMGKGPVEKAIFIAHQIAEGQAEAHRLGVIHRDLKPHNVMIDKEGNARIMDFGIARSLAAKGLTGEGIIIGIPEYMSPEQMEAKDVDQRSDIYSLGIILYEMKTGHLPFEGDSPIAIAVKPKWDQAKNPREINPQIPDDLNGIILRCLEKNKENRYQDAREVQRELEKVELGFPGADRIITEKKPLALKEITVKFNVRRALFPTGIVFVIAIV